MRERYRHRTPKHSERATRQRRKLAPERVRRATCVRIALPAIDRTRHARRHAERITKLASSPAIRRPRMRARRPVETVTIHSSSVRAATVRLASRGVTRSVVRCITTRRQRLSSDMVRRRAGRSKAASRVTPSATAPGATRRKGGGGSHRTGQGSTANDNLVLIDLGMMGVAGSPDIANHAGGYILRSNTGLLSSNGVAVGAIWTGALLVVTPADSVWSGNPTPTKRTLSM